MSFCNTKLPQGQQFLGVLVLEANDVIEGVSKAWELGLNPGGEIQAILIPTNKYVAKEWTEKLLSKEEALNLPFLDKT